MNTLKRMVMVVMDMGFVFLAMTAFIIVIGFFANLLVGGGHGHWVATGLALILAIALRIFIWLLPLTALMFFVGTLMGGGSSTANPK